MKAYIAGGLVEIDADPETGIAITAWSGLSYEVAKLTPAQAREAAAALIEAAELMEQVK